MLFRSTSSAPRSAAPRASTLAWRPWIPPAARASCATSARWAAGRGPAPLCWSWGSCSACWRLCCGLDPDCPARLPKLRKEGKPRPKRISKPPPLTPHPASPTFSALGPHRQAWPPVPTPASSPYLQVSLATGTWEQSLRIRESEPSPRDMLGGAPNPRPSLPPSAEDVLCGQACGPCAQLGMCECVWGRGGGQKRVWSPKHQHRAPVPGISAHVLVFHSLRGWPLGRQGFPCSQV